MQTTLLDPTNLGGATSRDNGGTAPPDAGERGAPGEQPAFELHLAEGIELLGEYKDSGYAQAPYLIRRSDRHTVQVSRLVYLVAEALVTHHDPESAAADVTERFGRDVSAENIVYLVKNKLVPVGVMAAKGSESTAPLATAKPLLALRLRLPLVPERVHSVATTALKPLFWPPIIVTALAALLVTDIWLVVSQRTSIGGGMRMVLFEPKLLLALTVLTLAAGVFHEFGHAAGARYGGATPGAMGAGIYLVWPVFYTDVTDTYRLDRRGRLRTDFGGIYFNVLFTLGTVWLFTMTGYAPLLVLAVLVQLESLRQFLPFVRLDGFYVMSDLAGVPNLFAYMKPVLTILVRRRNAEARDQARQKLAELTRRSRMLIIGWVVVTAPVLSVGITLFLVMLPRVAGVAWGSAGFQIDAMTTATGSITPVGVVNGTVNLLLLALPVAGMTYVLGMLLKRGSMAAARSWPTRPALTGVASGVALAVLVLQIGLVWPGTFSSALRGARGEPGQDRGRVPVQTPWGDLPAGLSVLAATPPAATPIRVVVPTGEPGLDPYAAGEPPASGGSQPQATRSGAARGQADPPGASGPTGASAPPNGSDAGSQRPEGPQTPQVPSRLEGPPAGNKGQTGPPAGDPAPSDDGSSQAPDPDEEPTPVHRLVRAVGGLLGFQPVPNF